MSEFRPLKSFPAYEISLEENKNDACYPYQIRNIKTKHVMKPYKSGRYVYVSLNAKPKTYHRILYEEGLIHKPDDFDPSHVYEIDHVNHDKHDNRSNNLRCIPRSINARSKIKTQIIDELPANTYMVTGYNDKQSFKPNSYFYNPLSNTMYRKLKHGNPRYKQMCDFRLYNDQGKCTLICRPSLLDVDYLGIVQRIEDIQKCLELTKTNN